MSYKKYLLLAEKDGVVLTRSPVPCRFSAGDSFSNAVRFSCDGEWMKDDRLTGSTELDSDQCFSILLPRFELVLELVLGHDAFRVSP